jgi:UDP-N-acetylglucosamine 2-epimerase (non-hydrolysing)
MNPVLLVVGTRPEGIKMLPVYFALQKAGIESLICSTSQHSALLQEVFDLFKVTPDFELHVMQQNQDLFHITTSVLDRIKIIYRKIKPSYVFVQGDTTTVMAATLAAFYEKIKVCHIEAGLRTGDIYEPFPEEANREIVGLLADLHFSPTALAVANLLKEGKKRESVFCVGNTVVDSLRIVQEKLDAGTVAINSEIEKAVAGCIIQNQKMVLLTMHRRESFGGGIESVLKTVKMLAQKYPDTYFFYPYHPNPHVVEVIEKIKMKEIENIYLSEPIAYKDLVYLLHSVDFVMTDSGGIQEEAVSLGKRVIILREKSERMEGVWHGLAALVGTQRIKLQKEFERIRGSNGFQTRKTFIYGDGYASEKIVRIILQQYKADQESESVLFGINQTRCAQKRGR